MTHERLIEDLVERGYLKTPRIIDAFNAVDRVHFVTPEYHEMAYADTALPIGYGATISQSATVAFMLEKLAPEVGDKVLDIGSGSGWTSALLAHIVGEKGHVFAVEIIEDLTKRARRVIDAHYPTLNPRITFISQNAVGGLPDETPFQRITAAAALTHEIPMAWKQQLAIGGKIVAPLLDSIVSIERTSEAEYEEDVFPGFVFVPFQDDR